MPRRVSSPVFVGRAGELATLEGTLARAREGVPSFAFVAGEPGVGKSRLVAELAARAGAGALVGHCPDLRGSVVPYAPLVEALRPVARAGVDAVLGGRARDRADVFEGLLALLERLGREQPLALVLEDLHWADPSTRDFLACLVRRARSAPLCVLGTYRSDELHRRHPLRPVLAELERTPGVRRIALARFTRDEVAEQVTGILDGTPADGLADRLYARGEGNPLSTEELLAASVDGQLPATPRDALLARVERLPAAARQVVRVAAVAERPLSHALLEAVCGLPDGAREAVAHQLLVARPDGTYAFRHALAGEAVYEDLLPGERTALHAALGAAIERDPSLLGDAPAAALPAALARHWRGAHDLPRALAASVAAGLQARRLHAPGEALRHLEHALSLWERVPDAAERAGMPRSAVLREAAAAARQGGGSSRAIALQREALAAAAADAAHRLALAGR